VSDEAGELLQFLGKPLLVDLLGGFILANPNLVGGLEHFLFSISYIMTHMGFSFPLTNSIIFQDGYCTTNQ